MHSLHSGVVHTHSMRRSIEPEVSMASSTLGRMLRTSGPYCANAVAFLCSDYARVITGAGLDVNGGEFMP